jgi:hypothetical protein
MASKLLITESTLNSIILEELRTVMGEEWDAELEEGLLDRIKARMSGVGGSGAAAKERAKGTIQYGLKGRADSTEGEIGDAYQRGKATKIINLYAKKMENISSKTAGIYRKQAIALGKDLKKLGLEIPGADDMAMQTAEVLEDYIMDSYRKMVKRILGDIEKKSGAELTGKEPDGEVPPPPSGERVDASELPDPKLGPPEESPGPYEE